MFLNTILKIYKYSSNKLKFFWNLSILIYFLVSISEIFYIFIISSIFQTNQIQLINNSFSFKESGNLLLNFRFYIIDNAIPILFITLIIKIISELLIAKSASIYCEDVVKNKIKYDLNLINSNLEITELNAQVRESARNGFICFNNIILSSLVIFILFVFSCFNALPAFFLIITGGFLSIFIERFITIFSNKFRNRYISFDLRSEEVMKNYKNFFNESKYGNFEEKIALYLFKPFNYAHKNFFSMLGLKLIPNISTELIIIIIIIFLIGLQPNFNKGEYIVYLFTYQRFFKYYAKLTGNRIAVRNNIPFINDSIQIVENNYFLEKNKDKLFRQIKVESFQSLIIKFNEAKSFSLERGLISINGNSGSGKTTLLKSIAGLFKSNFYVKIKLKNFSFNNENEKYFYIAKKFVWFEKQFPISLGKDIKSDIILSEINQNSYSYDLDKILDDLSLKSILRRKSYLPSGGELKRVGIARAIISNKRILLLDEPTSGLDENTSRKIADYLLKISKEKDKLIIVATHSKYLTSISDEVINI